MLKFFKNTFARNCSGLSIYQILTFSTAWILLLLVISLPAVFAEEPGNDWPQWQGYHRNAISAETGLLQAWPEAGPTLDWKIEGLGGGDSTPSIAAGKIYGMSNRDGDEIVWALSETDGSTLWATRLGPAFHQDRHQSNEGPGSTPTIDGELLYVVGLAGNIVCLNVNDGKIAWQRSMQNDFGGSVPRWSYRESPLVDGDKVICTPGSEDATLVALDKLTGKTIWKSKVDGSPKAAYSSAISIDFGDQQQYVQFTAETVVGVAAEDGKVLWRFDKPANRTGINCSTPVYHDGYIFAASAYDHGGSLAKLSKNEDGSFAAEEVYFSRRMQNHHGGMIINDGVLFGANGGNSGGYLVALDFLTGEVLWDERRSGRRAPKGSVALADGRLYYRTEDGTMLLIEPSAKEFLERGRFEQPDQSGKPTWAHPVIANGKLYLRDHDVLLCYDVKAR